MGIETKGNDGVKSSIEDANNDAFPISSCISTAVIWSTVGALTNQTTQLVLQANLNDGRQIEARGAVVVSSRE